jgi:hypothetical protein
MAADAVTIIPEPRSRRQLGDEGLLVLWRDGSEPRRRQGLACVLSMCPNPGCACRLVYVDGFVIDESVTAVSCDEDGLHVAMHAGATPLRVTMVEDMIAIVDPDSGETTAHPDLPEANDPALVDWLGSEMDDELLEVLHRYRARATGHEPERPRTDIDITGKRYWTCIYLCPYPDCDCHKVRVAFFPDDAAPGSGDTVGSVLLGLGGAEDSLIVEVTAECGAPDRVIRELWTLFERRHQVGAFLRRREAQAKAVGATLWQPAAKPVRAAPPPGRNDPCPCGSGRKFKKCCLGKEPSTDTQ